MGSVNDDVWFKYAQGIQTWAGKDGGKQDPNAMYFIASAVNKGPAAGSFVPNGNMNYTLSQLCDALISTASPVYNPGAKGSYFDNLSRYIRAVKLKQNMDQGLLQQLKELRAQAEQASDTYDEVENKVFAKWEKDRLTGKPAGISFQDWATAKAPNLFAAQKTRDGTAQAVTQLNSQIFGPDADQLTQQQSALLSASNKLLPATGLNMKVCSEQIAPADYRKYYEALQRKTIDTLPLMTEGAGYYAPEYTIDPTFKTTIDEWAQVPLDGPDEFTWSIKSEQVTKSSWTKLGHVEGSAGISYGWIRIGGGASKDWSDSKVTTETGSFEIELRAQRAGLFNVAPGAWNVKSFRLAYPETIGEVGTAKDAIQPTQLFCASRVKIRVRFSGSMETAFDNTVKSTKEGGGGISILGFTVNAGGGQSKEENTHKSDLVKKDGWYEIKPTLVAGGCSLLAVIGARFDAPP